MRPVRDVMDTVLEDSGVVANAEQATDSDLGEVFRHGRRRLGGTDEANELPGERRPDHEPPTLVCAPLHRFERSEEHTSELQSLMRISYAVFCLKKNNIT